MKLHPDLVEVFRGEARAMFHNGFDAAPSRPTAEVIVSTLEEWVEAAVRSDDPLDVARVAALFGVIWGIRERFLTATLDAPEPQPPAGPSSEDIPEAIADAENEGD